MVRLIDADALIAKTIIGGRRNNKTIIRYIVTNIVQNAPTVDAVPVIRCKDCRYNIDGCCDHTGIYQMISGDLIGFHFEPTEDFYCELAERKEE